MKLTTMMALFTLCSAAGIAQSGSSDVPAGACRELNEAAMKQALKGHVAEAEALLPPDLGACTGMVMGNVARIAAVQGHMAEAERLAEQSIRMLERFYPPDDWRLLRPLQILASVRLEKGKTARAREAIRRIQSIPIKRPEDRASVHGTVGALRQMEGRWREAEVEYKEALRAWEEAGRSESADAAAMFHCLTALYLVEHRLDDARQALDRAGFIHDRAKDSWPIDRIKYLYLRSVLHARFGEWQQCEQNLHEALSMADREPYVDPALFRVMLGSYAYVLRRNHHPREARSIEARRAAVPKDSTADAVVDATELLLEKKGAKH
jgi:hypothetical protein